MTLLDRIASPHPFAVSTAVTVVVAGWFALTFFVTVGAAIASA